MPQILLLFILILFGIVLNRKEGFNFKLWTLWGVGFIVLLSLIRFMKSIVFEWLEWNGTDKNDWVYILWWGLVVLWSVFGINLIKTKTK